MLLILKICGDIRAPTPQENKGFSALNGDKAKKPSSQEDNVNNAASSNRNKSQAQDYSHLPPDLREAQQEEDEQLDQLSGALNKLKAKGQAIGDELDVQVGSLRSYMTVPSFVFRLIHSLFDLLELNDG